MTDNALIHITDRLRKTTERSTLDELVNARTRRSILLIDVSSSMGRSIAEQSEAGLMRRIDKLRLVVADLFSTHPVPMVTFPGIQLVTAIPEPAGMTPLHAAIAFARLQEANHIVVITDGEPDSPNAAFAEADKFGGSIDVFYIGNGGDEGAKFCAELARRTGGQCGVTDLKGTPKQLSGKIVALLGDGGL